MKDTYMELHFSGKHTKLQRNKFMLELYAYAIKSKYCRHVELCFYKSDYNNIDKCIYDKLFASYSLEDSSISDTLLSQSIDNIEDVDTIGNSQLNEITLTAFIDSFSYETMESIQGLGWNKMMLYKEIQHKDSIVIGAYDYQNYIVISNIDEFDVEKIKEMLLNHFSTEIAKTITHID
ncbi:hypothetical protein DW1_2417 [Proteiniborus sp. DW1]|uniref:hypothetical protein n=1 Tax=Proteiniborus sp. DW1 TaxID=1889883 RepID=UPI00092DF29A|nr:hypothetical protein [Proteiniborus sp. DW1]SCG83981.1 hypothetical protein DW1_2417 [Proteiniborus sp. DW1]